MRSRLPNALTGEPNQVPLAVDGVDPYMDEPSWVPNAAGTHTQLQWINMAAFANAPTGQRGNTRRGHIYGPGFFNTDLAVSRNLELGTGKRIEVRVEMFNLFNHNNYAPFKNTVGSSLGKVTDTIGDYNGAPGIGPGEPFNTQLSLKLLF